MSEEKGRKRSELSTHEGRLASAQSRPCAGRGLFGWVLDNTGVMIANGGNEALLSIKDLLGVEVGRMPRRPVVEPQAKLATEGLFHFLGAKPSVAQTAALEETKRGLDGFPSETERKAPFGKENDSLMHLMDEDDGLVERRIKGYEAVEVRLAHLRDQGEILPRDGVETLAYCIHVRGVHSFWLSPDVPVSECASVGRDDQGSARRRQLHCRFSNVVYPADLKSGADA